MRSWQDQYFATPNHPTLACAAVLIDAAALRKETDAERKKQQEEAVEAIGGLWKTVDEITARLQELVGAQRKDALLKQLRFWRVVVGYTGPTKKEANASVAGKARTPLELEANLGILASTYPEWLKKQTEKPDNDSIYMYRASAAPHVAKAKALLERRGALTPIMRTLWAPVLKTLKQVLKAQGKKVEKAIEDARLKDLEGEKAGPGNATADPTAPEPPRPAAGPSTSRAAAATAAAAAAPCNPKPVTNLQTLLHPFRYTLMDATKDVRIAADDDSDGFLVACGQAEGVFLPRQEKIILLKDASGQDVEHQLMKPPQFMRKVGQTVTWQKGLKITETGGLYTGKLVDYLDLKFPKLNIPVSRKRKAA